MKRLFKKVNIMDYVQTHKTEFKKFKNVEKLKVVREVTEKSTEDKKYFLCVNQNGKELVKSDFMLEYDYTKLKNGSYVARYHKNVYAYQIGEAIEFSTSFGECCKLNLGDYVVMESNIVIGMSKLAFEENYKSNYKASKILKSYKEDTLTY